MMVRIDPKDRYYQVLLERCIEHLPYEAWDVYKDGDLYMDEVCAKIEIERANEIYGNHERAGQ